MIALQDVTEHLLKWRIRDFAEDKPRIRDFPPIGKSRDASQKTIEYKAKPVIVNYPVSAASEELKSTWVD